MAVHGLAMPKAKNTNNTSTKSVRTTVAAKVSHASASPSPRASAQDVAIRAYEIWEREGRPAGRDLEHWSMAESELGI
jgi:hypothetical protein